MLGQYLKRICHRYSAESLKISQLHRAQQPSISFFQLLKTLPPHVFVYGYQLKIHEGCTACENFMKTWQLKPQRVWGCGHNNNASLALPHTNCVTSVEAWQENAKIAHIHLLDIIEVC